MVFSFYGYVIMGQSLIIQFERDFEMDQFKDIRWRQRFINFEKSYRLLN